MISAEDVPADYQKPERECQHPQRHYFGREEADYGAGIITVTWRFGCADCGCEWQESAEYMTEKYYGIDE